MKAYIIGTNLDSYTILKKFQEYLIGDGIEVNLIEWLSKKEIDIENLSDADIYIWVEINELVISSLSFRIERGESKQDTINKFLSLLKEIKHFKANQQVTNLEPQEEAQEKVDNEIVQNNLDTVTGSDQYEIVVNKEKKKSSLVGVNIVIEGKEYYISKDEYEELYKLDDMLSKHGYKISSVVVED